VAEISEKSKTRIAKEIAGRIIRYENSILAMILAIVIGIMSVVTKGLMNTQANMVNILLSSSIRGVAAVGETFALLGGGVDLSVAGIGLVSAVLGARLMTSSWQNIIGHPIAMGLGIGVMLLNGVVWGAINGSLWSRVGIPSLIVTLGMWEITRGVAYEISKGRTIAELPDNLATIGAGNIAGIPVPVIIFIAAVVLAYFILHYTPYGRSVYASGGNPASAWLSGIDVRRIRFSVFVISGFSAGLASVIMTARTMAASMQTLTGLELDSLAAVFVGGVSLAGGKGTVVGVMIGVLIIGVINNAIGLLGASPTMQGIIKGVIIVTAVGIDQIRRR
jgi:ribose/xylose/arabinose/galactoside ABC-type transport system permease subunit